MRLLPSLLARGGGGRFTHHRDHVCSVVASTGLSLLSLAEAVLRYEYGEPVTGLVAVCRKERSPYGPRV